MYIRYVCTNGGSFKYWEFTSIKGTKLSLIQWGKIGQIGGRQIKGTTEAIQTSIKKINKGYKKEHDDKNKNISNFIIPKECDCILVDIFGKDKSFTTKKETVFQIEDIVDMDLKQLTLEDVWIFELPPNSKDIIKMIVKGSYINFK